MSTKLKIIDDTPAMEPEGEEFSFGGVTTDELSKNAMGGTEMMKHGLYDRLDPEIRDKVQIICSRVRDVDEDRPTILWVHDMFNDPNPNTCKTLKVERGLTSWYLYLTFRKLNMNSLTDCCQVSM